MFYIVYDKNDNQVCSVYDIEEARDICEDNDEYYIVKEYECRGCGKGNSIERFDAYGIHTGHYCNECYENNYPYRKDRYPTIEFNGYGERLYEY